MIDSQPTVRTSGRRFTDEAGVYRHLVSLQEQMKDAIAHDDGAEIVALKEAYDRTAAASPDVVSYLKQVSSLEKDSFPRRAEAARKALPVAVEEYAASIGKTLKVYTDEKYATAVQAAWGVSDATAEAISGINANKFDRRSPEYGEALAHAQELNTFAKKQQEEKGITSKTVIGGLFEQRKREAMIGAAPLMNIGGGDKVDTYKAMSSAYSIVDKSEKAGVRAKDAFDLQNTVLSALVDSYDAGDSPTARTNLPPDKMKQEVPYSDLLDASTRIVDALLSSKVPTVALPAFSTMLNDVVASRSMIKAGDSFSIRDSLTKLGDVAASWDERSFEDAAVEQGVPEDKKQKAREKLLYLRAVDSGVMKADQTKVSDARDSLEELGLGKLIPTNGVSDNPAERLASLSANPSRIVTKVQKLVGAPLDSETASALSSIPKMKASAAASGEDALNNLINRQNVPPQMVKLMSTVIRISGGGGIKNASDARRVLAGLDQYDAQIRESLKGSADALAKFDELKTAIRTAGITAEQLENRTVDKLSAAASEKAKLDPVIGVALANTAVDTASDSALGALKVSFKSPVSERVKMSVSALWKDPVVHAQQVRTITDSQLSSSSEKISGLDGMTVSELYSGMTATEKASVFRLNSVLMRHAFLPGSSGEAYLYARDKSIAEQELKGLLRSAIERRIRGDTAVDFDPIVGRFTYKPTAGKKYTDPDKYTPLVSVDGKEYDVKKSVLPALVQTLVGSGGSTADPTAVEAALAKLQNAEELQRRAGEALDAVASKTGLSRADLDALTEGKILSSAVRQAAGTGDLLADAVKKLDASVTPEDRRRNAAVVAALQKQADSKQKTDQAVAVENRKVSESSQKLQLERERLELAYKNAATKEQRVKILQELADLKVRDSGM